MFNKKIMILAIFLLGLLAVTAVSAADNATEDIVSMDENTVEELDTSQDEILTANPTIKDLNDKINNNQDPEISLDSNYTYADSDSGYKDGIEINRDVTIDGNGNTIDGGNEARIFHVISGTVVFKNITFINGFIDGGYASNPHGGAIFAEGGDIKVINCTFRNNTAGFFGGAISCDSPSLNVPCTIEDCNFYNNSAKSGGAISCKQYAVNKVINCNFTNNVAESLGGAILYCDAINCTFISNNAARGGAIYDGWATNSTFNSNRATWGGAIYTELESLDFFRCIFINNTASASGAAIQVYQNNCNISGCIFVENNASGGTICFDNANYYRNLKINNNIFLNNTGPAINFGRNDDQSNADFNWFGHNATNYDDNPNMPKCQVWLFLNATSDKNPIVALSTCLVTFDLYAYDSSSQAISRYDPDLLMPVNLTITAENGDIDRNVSYLGQAIEYTPTGIGENLVTATMGNAVLTFEENVNKIDPGLSLESDDVTYSENTVMVLHYNASATGKVNITLTGKRFNKTLVLDIDSALPLGAVLPDEYNVTVSYDGEGLFSNATANATLKVSKLATGIVSEPVVTLYGDDDYLTANLTDENGNALSGVEVTVNINGDKNYPTDENGTIKVPLKGVDADEYLVNITYGGNDIFLKSNATANLTVGKAKTEITANPVTAIYNIDNYLIITLKDAQGRAISDATITVNLNGNMTRITDANGQANVSTIGLTPDFYTAEISFGGNGNYNASNATAAVTIDRDSSSLTADPITTTYNAGKELVIVLKDSLGRAIANATITVNLNGNVTRVTDANGQARLSTTGLTPKTYTAQISFGGNGNYNASNATAAVTINKDSTSLAASAITATYNVNKYLTITLKDSKGKALSSVKVTVNLNGAKTYTTDKNGKIKVPTKGLAPKVYTAKIAFNGNANYVKSTKNVKVTVKKATPKLTAKSKKFKKSVKVKKYAVVLKSNVGKAIKNAKVTLKIKGKKAITVKTNAKGKATFKIKKLTKKGKYKATVTFKGNKYYNKVTKTVKITVR